MASIAITEVPIPLPDPTPASLKGWLMELPFANTAYCLAALLRVVRAFNATPQLRPAVRFELADSLEPYVAMLVERTEKPLLSTSMPHLPIVRSAEQGVSLYWELATAYALACPAKSLLGSLWQREELCQASYRSLRHWGLYLLGMAQLYRLPGEGFWPSVYRVYRQAEEFGVISRPLDVSDEPSACRTVRGQFKRIMLFALGGGGRFRPRDMRHVYTLLGELADSVNLEQRPPDRDFGRFQVCLDSEQPPLVCPEHIKPTPADRFFSTSDLVANLMGDPLPVMGSHGGDAHSRHLQSILARSLNGGRNRKSSRLKSDQACRLYIGLSEIIEALTPRVRADAVSTHMPISNLDPIDWTKRSPYDLMPADAHFRRLYRGDQRLPENELYVEQIVMDGWSHLNDPPVTPNPGNSSVAKSRVVGGMLVNTSPHGYCIMVAEIAQLELQIGVPVGIVEEEGAMFLGTVRWLMREDGGIKFGVKLLSPSAEVVEIRLMDGSVKGKGLLLPADRFLRREPELVVMPRLFRVNSELSIEGKDKIPRAYFGQICEQTLAFSRMTLTPSRLKPEEKKPW